MESAISDASDRPLSRRVALARTAAALLIFWTAGAVGCSTVQAQPGGGERCPKTAAAAFGWGEPNRRDEFSDASSINNWWVYDGVGHAGNGRRTPKAVSVADGAVTITGDTAGNAGGMAAKGPGQRFGRWEVCAKSSPAAKAYHSVLLVWPDAEDWPVGGEIDFMEISDPSRQQVEAYLHYGPNDLRHGGAIGIDATQWHSWAVEWTPTRITTFVDGVLWWATTDSENFPPRLMHIAMQLDNFGGDTAGGGQLSVDWAREYSVGRRR